MATLKMLWIVKFSAPFEGVLQREITSWQCLMKCFFANDNLSDWKGYPGWACLSLFNFPFWINITTWFTVHSFCRMSKFVLQEFACALRQMLGIGSSEILPDWCWVFGNKF